MTNARCWVALPLSLPPHHLPHSRPLSVHPPSFLLRQVDVQWCVSPYHFRTPPFTHPLCTGCPTWPPPLHPPSHCTHSISTPSPFRANGDVNGVGCTLLPLVRGP